MRPLSYFFLGISYPVRDTREEPHPLRQPSCDGRVGLLIYMSFVVRAQLHCALMLGMD